VPRYAKHAIVHAEYANLCFDSDFGTEGSGAPKAGFGARAAGVISKKVEVGHGKRIGTMGPGIAYAVMDTADRAEFTFADFYIGKLVLKDDADQRASPNAANTIFFNIT
jgi:hypothetical protein